tara:strand:+ start:1537 stop:1749 length:213 start_codon:yes stop_codon:yes gene_type:complete
MKVEHPLAEAERAYKEGLKSDKKAGSPRMLSHPLDKVRAAQLSSIYHGLQAMYHQNQAIIQLLQERDPRS